MHHSMRAHRMRAHRRRVRATLVATSLSVLALTVAFGGSPVAATNRNATVLTVRHATLGDVVTSHNGLTLYLFERDSGTKSTCTGGCAGVWTPLIAHGQLKALNGAEARLLGTTKRSSGVKQVTYAGHPTYLYVGDKVPGSVTGEGLQSFGGGWDAIAPSGKKIEMPGA
jgi:predicted lipoprotein with Yx(FWY)xxD motif